MPAEIRRLPRPSKGHATCAWCHSEHADIVDLLTHVDTAHLPASSATAAA